MTRSTGDVDDGPDTEGATTTGDGVAAISDAACGVERSARGASAAAAGFLAFFFILKKISLPSCDTTLKLSFRCGAFLR
mgnify:CR=1 FL=1